MKKQAILELKNEIETHLQSELLPFWLDRCKDDVNGGFITHFDKDGNDTGEDHKSLIAQARTTYIMAAAHHAGYGGPKCRELATHGVDFLIDKMWDKEHGGFYWTVDRKGNVQIDKKILYGMSFAIYALSEYTIATDDPRGLAYAEKVFDLIHRHAVDAMYGGYFEMFERDWQLCPPGSAGGDRKTLDFHMHLMEALTQLYQCSQNSLHKRRLKEVITLLVTRILHPQHKTGIPQFWQDWSVAPQIKFDIVWGWDRFDKGGVKHNADDNTSAGHNVEFAWLLLRALDIMDEDPGNYLQLVRQQLDHALANGIDREYGGVFTEGPHAGGVSETTKEFWQQAEVMIGMLEGCLRFNDPKYWDAYVNVHRFVFDKMINHKVGEWWPLLNREGTQCIWTHMSHSWKVCYHTVRAMLQCANRLDTLQKVSQ